jgi:hypothetical protein
LAIPVNLLKYRSLLRLRAPLQVQILARFRVRRPISGLVRDNYPSGRTATYHFIPKQTTCRLYTNAIRLSRGESRFFEKNFGFFSCPPALKMPFFRRFPAFTNNTLAGVSLFFLKSPFSGILFP